MLHGLSKKDSPMSIVPAPPCFLFRTRYADKGRKKRKGGSAGTIGAMLKVLEKERSDDKFIVPCRR